MSKNNHTGKIPYYLNKGGRPSIGKNLSEQEKEREIYEIKKNKLISFRVSELEKEKFKEKYSLFLKKNDLKKSNYSMSNFIIDIFFERDFNKLYKDNNLSKLSFDINKIGININQVAKRINSYSNINSHKIEQDLLELKKKLNDIYLIMDKK